MMTKTLVLLGGNNPENYSWLARIGTNLASDHTVYVHRHAHWDKGGEIDFQAELSALRDYVAGLEDYAVVAKSAGALVALMGRQDVFAAAEKIVAIGMPVHWANDRGINCQKLLVPSGKVGYIQATSDPQCTYAELVQLLGSNENVEKYHSYNHGYSKVATICQKARRLLNG